MSGKEKEALVPPERLRELFIYTPSTGVVVWRNHQVSRGHRRFALEPAGGVGVHGYLRIRIGNLLFCTHRIAWAMHHGEWPDGEIDHIDRNPMNNKIENLRIASRSENMHNSVRPKNNTSGIKGVSWDKQFGKWAAYVGRHGKLKRLGRFASKEDAATARAWVELLDPSTPIQHITQNQPEGARP